MITNALSHAALIEEIVRLRAEVKALDLERDQLHGAMRNIHTILKPRAVYASLGSDEWDVYKIATDAIQLRNQP